MPSPILILPVAELPQNIPKPIHNRLKMKASCVEYSKRPMAVYEREVDSYLFKKYERRDDGEQDKETSESSCEEDGPVFTKLPRRLACKPHNTS